MLLHPVLIRVRLQQMIWDSPDSSYPILDADSEISNLYLHLSNKPQQSAYQPISIPADRQHTHTHSIMYRQLIREIKSESKSEWLISQWPTTDQLTLSSPYHHHTIALVAKNCNSNFHACNFYLRNNSNFTLPIHCTNWLYKQQRVNNNNNNSEKKSKQKFHTICRRARFHKFHRRLGQGSNDFAPGPGLALLGRPSTLLLW